MGGLDPQGVGLTTKLADRVQAALTECNTCVFVATKRSAKSNWCTAETAAYWGRNLPIFVFGADAGFSSRQLPPHLDGHYVEFRLRSLVDALKKASRTTTLTPAALQPMSAAGQTEITTALLVEILRTKLLMATSELEHVRASLLEYERHNPGGTHTGMEGFEMACASHVRALATAIAELQNTQGTLWSLR